MIAAATDAFSDSVRLPSARGMVIGWVMSGRMFGLMPCDSLPMTTMQETENRSIYYEYDDLQTNIYFEGITKSVVACFETENENATLYGKKVFDLDQKAVIEMMKAKGFNELEQETEDGELRISFADIAQKVFYARN